MIPNFFDPDLTSTASHKMTPLNVNNSYVHMNNSKLNNGSFLESKNTPQKNSLNLSTKNNKIPTFVINEVDTDKLNTTNSTLDNEEIEQNDEKKCCPVCHTNFVIKKSTCDLMMEFDIETVEYSPNKKCANFLENMILSPNRDYQRSSSVTNTPQSTAKKTLLVKAIKNNANNFDKSNISLDEMSIVSTCSTKSSYLDDACSSPSGSPCKKKVSFSNVDMSELDETNEIEDDLCEKCRLVKLQREEDEKSKQEVSLYMEENDLNDEIEVDGIKKANKRKACLNRADSDQNLDAFEQRRRTSILSDLNVNNVENNVTSESDKNKKFKNQVTSTPAAMNHIKLIPNTANKLKTDEKMSNRMRLQGNKYLSEGMFFGRGKHNDGSFIRIFFQRKNVKINKDLEDQDELICVWVCRDPYSDKSIIDCSLDQSQVNYFNFNVV